MKWISYSIDAVALHRLQCNYDIDDLLDIQKYVVEDIQSLEEYKEKIAEQIKTVENTKFKHIVKFKRLQAFNKRIQYVVNVCHVPCVEKGDTAINYRIILNKVFPGKKRHEAKKRAEELAKIYHAEVEDNTAT